MWRAVRIFATVFLARRVTWTMMVTLWLASRVVAAEPDAPHRVVFIVRNASHAGDVFQTFDGVQGQLGELVLDIRVAHSDKSGPVSEQAAEAAGIAQQLGAGAAFWFVPNGSASVRVYALHVLSRRVFVRAVALAEHPAMRREQLAIVLRAAIPAVLNGADDLGEPVLVVKTDPASEPRPSADTQPTPAVPATVTPLTLPSPPPPGPLRLAVGYSVGAVSRQADWQSGMSAELVLDLVRNMRVSLGGGYSAPIRIHGVGADALISRVPMVARFGVGTARGRAAVGLEAGALAEAWSRRTEVQAENLLPKPPSTVWRLGAVASARAELSLGFGVGVYILGEAQWLPASHTLNVDSRQTTQQLPTLTLRPQLALGVTVDLPWWTSSGEGE